MTLSVSESRAEIKFEKQEASLIPFVNQKIRFTEKLDREFSQAKESGVLSDYQSVIWAGIVTSFSGIKNAGEMIELENYQTFVKSIGRLSNPELDEYQVSEQILNQNHAYQNDWELSLWHLAE